MDSSKLSSSFVQGPLRMPGLSTLYQRFMQCRGVLGGGGEEEEATAAAAEAAVALVAAAFKSLATRGQFDSPWVPTRNLSFLSASFVHLSWLEPSSLVSAAAARAAAWGRVAVIWAVMCAVVFSRGISETAGRER